MKEIDWHKVANELHAENKRQRESLWALVNDPENFPKNEADARMHHERAWIARALANAIEAGLS